MANNNSVTNRNIRRAAALQRFSIDNKKAAEDKDYLERKEAERTALESRINRA